MLVIGFFAQERHNFFYFVFESIFSKFWLPTQDLAGFIRLYS